MQSFTRFHTAAVAGLSVLALTAFGTGSAAALGTHASTARANSAASAAYTVGAPGSGDPYFPYDGNGGYDVLHYDLALRYAPPTDPAALVGKLSGIATITLRAKQNLQSLNFDLRGLDVTSVRVDGKAAAHGKSPGNGSAEWSQKQDDANRFWELTVGLLPKLREGKSTTIIIEYGGNTGRPLDTTGALYGWVTTADGAMVVNEPDGASTWYPVNDDPQDKATYSFHITVPEGKTAVANGLADGRPRTKAGWTTWSWEATDPMSSYLATATVGDFTLANDKGTHGLPIVNAIDAGVTGPALAETKASLALQPQMIAFLEGTFGRYPFESFGAIVDDDSVDYALETQTRPVYSQVADEATVVHELGHQWFGDSVTPSDWKDIWLNEGWATYIEWLWAEHQGTATIPAQFANAVSYLDANDGWTLNIADPGRDELFAAPVYLRGAAALHSLRAKVGDKAFFAGARLWLNRYKGSTATTADFEAVMEKTSGQSLTTFFNEWLRQGVRPATAQLQAEPSAGPSNATQGPAASDPNTGHREAR
ncbi:M1 family metallopeptidase [Cryobacterium zhongshanensis]|uniref:Aminopeptidase N n=1 Tax=Cryobacterium zhongshanensis TaxID=2928153 RepID=A0AA41QUR5_9MICO|nr:M1 family metallopeptidase [Cryobacterium zhongshanensis]MCI4658090.1 M1 family metallopeptidase [Cryobacterium zhongshanensis]